jgi:hypothetical protein
MKSVSTSASASSLRNSAQLQPLQPPVWRVVFGCRSALQQSAHLRVLQLVEQQHHQQYHHHANLLLIRPVNCSYFNVFVLRARVHNINTIATTTKIDSANNVGGVIGDK